MGLEPHAGKPVTRVLRRKPLVVALRVEDAMHLSLHRGHRIDHPGHGGDIERIHHTGRGQMKLNLPVDRHGKVIDRRNALIGIDEQPFPVERHNLDPQRRLGSGRLGRTEANQRTVRVQKVSANPGQGPKADDDQQRRGPDQQLQLGGMVPVGVIGRVVGCGAVFPRKDHGQRHHWQDDQQHEAGGDHQKVALLGCHIARRGQHLQLATGHQSHAGHQDRLHLNGFCHFQCRLALLPWCALGLRTIFGHWTLCPMPWHCRKMLPNCLRGDGPRTGA